MPREAKAGKGRPMALDDVAAISRQALRLVQLSRKWQSAGGRSRLLVSLSVYPPVPPKRENWLVVAKAFDEGYRVVAFFQASTMLAALVRCLEQCGSGTAKWQPDKFDQ